MKNFILRRTEDVSGTSGIGVVAEGVQFENGKCVISWINKHTSIAIYENIEELIAIHGHEGRTKVVWLPLPYQTCLKCLISLKVDKIDKYLL
jgi:hypothetical protein